MTSSLPEPVRRMGRPFVRVMRSIRSKMRASTSTAFDQAKTLNDELYADINSIPKAELERFTQEIQYYCDQRNYQEWTKAWIAHRYRLYLSIEWLKSAVRQPDTSTHLRALDLGAESLSTDLLRHYFPNYEWINSQGDLRYTWQEEDETLDLVICTELLEHVSDFPDGLSDSFRMTGLKALLQQAYRVLKPGGIFFVTTPNVATIFNIKKILGGYSPWFYPLHVREYTVEEILEEVKLAGFTIQRNQTVHCMTVDYIEDYAPIYEMLLKLGYSTKNRGDDIFLIARK